MLPCRTHVAVWLVVAAAVGAFAGCSDELTEPTNPDYAGLPGDSSYGAIVHHRDVDVLNFTQAGNARRFVLSSRGGAAGGPIFHYQSQAPVGYTGVTFEARAAIAPPEVGGDQVQIADLAIDGARGIALANLAGDASKGALQVFDLTDPYAPVLSAELLLPNAEYNSAVLSGVVVYALGNDDTNAIIDVIDVSDPSTPAVIARQVLPAQTALAAYATGTRLSVVTGRDGGLFTFNVSNPAAPSQTALVPLNDGRHVSPAPGGLVVLTGEGAMFIESDVGSQFVPIAGLPAQAPTRGTVVGSTYYVNTVDGLVAVDLYERTATLVMSWAEGTPNGLASDDDVLFFRANGEAGLQLAHQSEGSWTALGSLDLANAGSSNSVAVGQSVWFSGDGRGGVLIGAFQYDIFDDFSGQLVVPYPWEEVTGNWVIETKDGRSVMTCPTRRNPSDRRVFWNNDAQWSDVQVDVVANLDRGNGYGVYVRAQDVTDGTRQDSYVFQYDPGYESGSFLFRRIHDGKETAPIAFKEKKNIPALASSPWYDVWRHVRVVAQGTTLRAWVDGVLVVEIEDATFTTGTVGFRAWSESQAWFDEVRVTQL